MENQGIWETMVELCGALQKVLWNVEFLSNLDDTKSLDNAQLKQGKTFKIMKAQRLGFFLLAVECQTSKMGKYYMFDPHLKLIKKS